MRAAVQAHVGTDQGARPDRDQARVDDDAVGVDVDPFAHLEVEPVVDLDGRLDPGLALEQGVVLGGVVRRRRKRGLVIDDPVRSARGSTRRGGKIWRPS